ncbi:MAG: hypothetical protein ACRC2T_05800 [Thermoguttaceae bacterium]
MKYIIFRHSYFCIIFVSVILASLTAKAQIDDTISIDKLTEEEKQEFTDMLNDTNFLNYLKRQGKADFLTAELPSEHAAPNSAPAEALQKINVTQAKTDETDALEFTIENEIQQLRWTLFYELENLRNAETPGYKCRYFQIVEPKTISKSTNNKNDDAETTDSNNCIIDNKHLHVKKSEPIYVKIDPKQGSFQETKRTLDLAIDGEGFFCVSDPNTNETLYTRYGEFELDENNELVLITENVVRILEPRICVPADSKNICVSPNGVVSAVIGFETTSDETKRKPVTQEIGRITLATFFNPNRLKPVDSHCFATSTYSGSPVICEIEPDCSPNTSGQLNTRIVQGNLESSNVNPTKIKERIEKIFSIIELYKKINR